METVGARLRVRYAETDQMGIVYYANYLVWMELGRAEYCRAAGIRYRDMEANDGILLAVAEASCRYASPALYDEEVIVKTWIEDSNPRMIRFGYEMLEAVSERRLASGETKHIFLNRERSDETKASKYRHLRSGFEVVYCTVRYAVGELEIPPMEMTSGRSPLGASEGTVMFN